MRRAHERDDHSFKKHRRHVQVTKKLNCPVQIKVRHIIRFPEYGAASMTQPPDERVKAFIRQMVFENDVRSTTHMKLLLENNNRNNIFKGRALPPKTNSRFWPSKKTIRNHIALAIVRQRHSNNDQVALEELVTRWKDEYPQDNFFLRLKGDEREQG
ncbi:hypothetical protein FSP39_023397 [Pinctada imbricata]|uniref:Uncharacterized protein n=1 Tax=Pinctada imbricata TaxID=66713 RepID=A0AA88YMH3_PINIB|nr:hypothetical protein FSP39_023397 [Pinctada imbricata]